MRWKVTRGDTIFIDAKVGLRCLGEDENRSFEALYTIDENEEETELTMPKVGYGHGFPIIKGRVKQISLLTAKEKRLNPIRSKLENT